MAIKNGHYMRLRIDAANIAKSTECTMSFSQESQSVSHKDTAGDGGGWSNKEPGEKSATFNGTFYYEEGDSNSFPALFTAYAAGTKVAVEFSDNEGGNNYWDCPSAVITSLEMNAVNNEPVSCTVSIDSDGPVTLETV